MSAKTALLPKWSLSHLDMVRGLAAIAVNVFHVRGLLFLDFESGKVNGAFAKLVYLLTGFGHQAVVVFFVLSGVFIGHSVLGAHRSGTWSWTNFLLHRSTRLYAVLIPALLLTFAWDAAGMHLFGSDGNIYAAHGNAPHGVFTDVRQTGGFATFAGNLFFLQSIVTQPYGSNAPLWSLSLEWWMYILFAIVMQVAVGRDASGRVSLGKRAALIVAGAGIFFMGGRGLALYFGIWLMGAAVAGVWPRTRLANAWVRRAAVGGSGAFFAATLLVARLGKLHSVPVEDLALGAGTAVFALALLSAGGTAQGPREAHPLYARTAKWLASFSYTLYLVHFPPLVLIHAWRFQAERWEPTMIHLAYGALVALAVIVLYAYPLSRLTEAHTDRLRRWIQQRFLSRELGRSPK